MTEATVEDNALTAHADDVVVEAPEAVIEEPAVVEAVAEPEKEPEPEEKPHHLKGKTPWYMERINEETNKRRVVEEQLQQKAREAEESRQLLERLQNGDKAPPKAETRDIDALVKAEAARLVFEQERSAVIAAGHSEFGSEAFGQIASILGAAGAATEEFIQDVIAVDKANAHKILDVLAKDPERARALSNMDLRRRTAELTRISDKMIEPKAPAPVVRSGVSKVPAPKPVVDAVSDNLGEMDLTNDKLDDDTWSKMWNKKYRKTA